MSTATALLRRALDALHFDLSAKESAKVAEEIRAFLAAEPETIEPMSQEKKEQVIRWHKARLEILAGQSAETITPCPINPFPSEEA